MKRYHLFIFFLLFVSLSSAQEWKRVETDMFSVEVPASWISEHGNTPRVVDVKSRNFRQYSIRWKNPESKDFSTRSESMLLVIESYTGLNDSVLPFSMVENMAVATPAKVLSTQRKEFGKGKVRLTILQEDKEISMGRIKRYNQYRHVLLLRNKDLIHVVTVSARENYLKEQESKLKDVERILNSFEVK